MKKERYGITDAHYLCNSAIFDTKTSEILRLNQICDLLNQKDKVLTLREYIEQGGYTIEEWDKTVGELCANGVGRGCYQDYNLLIYIIQWLCDYDAQAKKE